MYNIYVTNQSEENVYIRLRRQTISYTTNNFPEEVDKLSRGEDVSQNNSGLHSYLVKKNFCMISPQKTMSFTIGVGGEPIQMFASLFARSKLWIMDYEVDYLNFGCLFVTIASAPGSEAVFYLIQANPQPVWIPAKKGDKLPANIIQADIKAKADATYFGRSILGTPCRVTSVGGQCGIWSPGDDKNMDCGELLQDTGYQWIRALSGDPVPPNALIVRVSDPEGSQYLGRVGGGTPCSISATNGKIKYFCYFWLGEEKRVENGELMVLTNNASPQ